MYLLKTFKKAYGVCRNTGQLIEKEKLLTSPHGRKNEE